MTIEAGGRGNFAENVVIQPDGLIVLSGWSGKPDNQFDQVTDLARYQPDGQLDPTFGTGGTLTLDANVGADLVSNPTAGSSSSAIQILCRPRRAVQRRSP